MKTRFLAFGLLAVAVGGVGWVALRPISRAEPAAPAVPTTTAPVTRGTVTQRVQVAGTLGFDGEYQVVGHLPPGVLTRTAAPGTTVGRGGALFTISGTTVLLLIGDEPAYRGFAQGMADGPDVRALEQNLDALGMRPGRVDNHFDTATAAAVRRWQQARGLPPAQRTGTVPFGQVVFLPGEMRIKRAEVATGASIGPGAPVLTASTTTHVVTVPLTTDRQHLLKVGNQVQVVLPGAAGAAPGTVSSVGRVAAAAQNPANPPVIPVTVSVQLPAGAGDLDQAPVQVAITTARHENVLTVPVTALLAKAGGGYQVRVAPSRLLDVQPGLFDDAAGTVEVAGQGLAEGMTVEVPA